MTPRLLKAVIQFVYVVEQDGELVEVQVAAPKTAVEMKNLDVAELLDGAAQAVAAKTAQPVLAVAPDPTPEGEAANG